MPNSFIINGTQINLNPYIKESDDGSRSIIESPKKKPLRGELSLFDAGFEIRLEPNSFISIPVPEKFEFLKGSSGYSDDQVTFILPTGNASDYYLDTTDLNIPSVMSGRLFAKPEEAVVLKRASDNAIVSAAIYSSRGVAGFPDARCMTPEGEYVSVPKIDRSIDDGTKTNLYWDKHASAARLKEVSFIEESTKRPIFESATKPDDLIKTLDSKKLDIKQLEAMEETIAKQKGAALKEQAEKKAKSDEILSKFGGEEILAGKSEQVAIHNAFMKTVDAFSKNEITMDQAKQEISKANFPIKVNIGGTGFTIKDVNDVEAAVLFQVSIKKWHDSRKSAEEGQDEAEKPKDTSLVAPTSLPVANLASKDSKAAFIA